MPVKKKTKKRKTKKKITKPSGPQMHYIRLTPSEVDDINCYDFPKHVSTNLTARVRYLINYAIMDKKP